MCVTVTAVTITVLQSYNFFSNWRVFFEKNAIKRCDYFTITRTIEYEE